jgi:GT2 family glycosyltransferase
VTALPEISLVVVTRDRAELVARHLIHSLEDAVLDGAEVVVVDQSSDERTAELVRGLTFVRHIRSGPGLSRGRNAGIAASSAAFVVFTDDDVSFPPTWPRDIASALEGAPGIGAVCGRAIDGRGELLAGRRAGIYRHPTSPFALGSGFNMAFRRDALDAAGPFDEELGAGARYRSGEDSDMLYRVMRAGWAVLCRDDITVVHHDWRTPAEEIALHRGYGVGAGAQTAKHLQAGDRTAGWLAALEAGGHIVWIVRSLLRLRTRSMALQLAWLRGFLTGLRRRRACA